MYDAITICSDEKPSLDISLLSFIHPFLTSDIAMSHMNLLVSPHCLRDLPHQRSAIIRVTACGLLLSPSVPSSPQVTCRDISVHLCT